VWLTAALGGHTRPCIFVHESEASAAFHKEDDETVFPRCCMQGLGWTQSDPR